jgi:hypothetical protein
MASTLGPDYTPAPLDPVLQVGVASGLAAGRLVSTLLPLLAQPLSGCGTASWRLDRLHCHLQTLKRLLAKYKCLPESYLHVQTRQEMPQTAVPAQAIHSRCVLQHC